MQGGIRMTLTSTPRLGCRDARGRGGGQAGGAVLLRALVPAVPALHAGAGTVLPRGACALSFPFHPGRRTSLAQESAALRAARVGCMAITRLSSLGFEFQGWFRSHPYSVSGGFGTFRDVSGRFMVGG